MLLMDFDFSFFTGLFGSKEDEEKEEKKDKENKEQKNNKKTSKKETTKEKEKAKEKEEKKIEENNENKININKKEEKKEINKIEENTNKNQEKKEIKKESHKNQKDNEKKLGLNKRDEILKFLVNYIKNVYLYRKQVKKLIQRQKDNYSIISSINSKDLSMEIYLSEDNTQKVKYTYEPILQQNIFYIPKSNFKKKNLLKFSFLNKKKESIIDPKFNTEYDCGEFINVINLKKIKDKEEEKEEDFQTFLESYYTLRQSMSKQSFDKNKLKLETIRVKKRHKTMDSHKKGLVFGGNKLASSSILKQRGEHRRVTSNKKISFSDKNETLSYKKDD